MSAAGFAVFLLDLVAKTVRAVLDGDMSPEQGLAHISSSALARVPEAAKEDDAVDARVDDALNERFPEAESRPLAKPRDEGGGGG